MPKKKIIKKSNTTRISSYDDESSLFEESVKEKRIQRREENTREFHNHNEDRLSSRVFPQEPLYEGLFNSFHFKTLFRSKCLSFSKIKRSSNLLHSQKEKDQKFQN